MRDQSYPSKFLIPRRLHQGFGTTESQAPPVHQRSESPPRGVRGRQLSSTGQGARRPDPTRRVSVKPGGGSSFVHVPLTSLLQLHSDPMVVGPPVNGARFRVLPWAQDELLQGRGAIETQVSGRLHLLLRPFARSSRP